MEKTILDSAYVKRQLIAYIGNKRSILLPKENKAGI